MAGFKVGTSKVGSTDPIGVADAPAAAALDEADWWSGAKLAGIAIAGAAALLSTNVAIAQGFNHQDEVSARVNSGQGSGSAVNRRAQQTTGFQHWYQSDDIAPLAVQPVDETEWWTPPVVAQPVVSRVWTLEDDAPTTPVAFAADDDWQPPRIASVTVAPMVFREADELPTAATPLNAEDEFRPWIEARLTAPVVKVWSGEDERPTPASFSPPDDEWSRFKVPVDAITAVVWAETDDMAPSQVVVGGAGSGNSGRRAVEGTRFQRWWSTDDIAPQGAQPIDDAPGWMPDARPQPIVARLWSLEDDVPSTPATFAADDDWQPPRSVPAALVPQPFADTDEVQRAQVDDEYWQPLATNLVQPLARLWQQQDDLIPAASPLQVTDDYWLSPPVPQVAPVTLLWQQQDERNPVAAPLQGEDEYWQAPPVPIAAPVNRVWTLDDVLVPRPAIDDDYARELFTIPTPPVNRVWMEQDFVVPRPGIDDEYARELFAVKVPPFNRVWVWQDEWSSGIVPDVFTVDSRERLGGRRAAIGRGRVGHKTDTVPDQSFHGTVNPGRIGSGDEAVPDRRIGGPNARVGAGRLGWKKT
jgi:hypothetical protein